MKNKQSLTPVLILVLEDIVKLKFSLQTWRRDNISSAELSFSLTVDEYGWTHSFAYIYLLTVLNKQLERACCMWIFETKHSGTEY